MLHHHPSVPFFPPLLTISIYPYHYPLPFFPRPSFTLDPLSLDLESSFSGGEDHPSIPVFPFVPFIPHVLLSPQSFVAVFICISASLPLSCAGTSRLLLSAIISSFARPGMGQL